MIIKYFFTRTNCQVAILKSFYIENLDYVIKNNLINHSFEYILMIYYIWKLKL